jgi:hypothetical protein
MGRDSRLYILFHKISIVFIIPNQNEIRMKFMGEKPKTSEK